MAIKTSIIK